MKVKLFVLSALILLSSINSIFNSLPIIGVSAQEYEEIDYGSPEINEMVESYSYEEPSAYNTDNGYSNEEAEYSSYDNYEYSSDNEYVQDDYSTYNPSSYENEYSENSYDENYYPPKEPKKFTCQDSGIVVDKEENCPLVCPAGTDLEGHLVAAGSNLQVACDEDAAQFETCPAGTDLDGVLVTNAPEDCNIFATCDANDPLGRALGLTGAQTVEVADAQLCELTIPAGVNLSTCPAGSNLGEGALVTDLQLCNAATPADQCPVGSTLEGVWVNPDELATTCNIPIPPPVPTVECPAGTPLAGATVTDERLCQFEDIPLFTCSADSNLGAAVVTDQDLCNAATPAEQCPVESDLAGVWVNPDELATTCAIQIPPSFVCPAGTPLAGATVTDERLCQFEDIDLITCPAGTNNAGALVTDERLCEAPNNDNICADGTDLAGVYVTDPATECDLDFPETVQCPPGSNLPPGSMVTAIQLCFAATPAVQCASGSDLAGVWVNSTATAIAQCNISPADITIERNPQAQCLKCADLAALFGGNNAAQQQTFANLLIGTTTNNIFTICQAADPRPGFNALSTVTAAETAFDTCLDNAAVTPGTEPRAGTPAPPPPVPTALQENSLTTNIQSEDEIPTESEISTFSPPTIAQGVEGLQ